MPRFGWQPSRGTGGRLQRFTQLERVRTAAEEGDADAQSQIGLMYFLGDGVPKDDAKAVEWFRKAAEQGNADAQSMLGSMYGHGRGVPEDDAMAAKWFRKAAEQGFALAQTQLGLMHYHGEGVPENYVRAYAWLSIGAAQGNEQAKESKNIISELMTRQQIAEAQELSGDYWQRFVVPFRE